MHKMMGINIADLFHVASEENYQQTRIVFGSIL